MNLLSKIESILFVASKPLSIKKIAKSLKVDESKVEQEVETLIAKYNHPESGIHILQNGLEIQMSTNPENSEAIESFVKDEVAGELTRAQLETLTVIAYRGPVSRAELEQIRGVNCAIIIRNLLIRGLVTEVEASASILPNYQVSLEALRELGVSDPSELPNFEKFHSHAHLEYTLQEKN